MVGVCVCEYMLWYSMEYMSSYTAALFFSETPSEVADKPNLTWLDAAQVNISLK